jgi:hypothetical protein
VGDFTVAAGVGSALVVAPVVAEASAARSSALRSSQRPRNSPTMGVCKSIVTTLYGELQHEQLVQASYFSALLCFVVGIYWMMRSLKDSVFATLVGLEYQPQAKMLSLFVVTAVLFAYNKVVDLVERNRLFAVICGSYALVFVAIAVCLKSTSFGLYGDDGAPLPPSPERLLGWVHYFAIESYGSLAVSLFWQWTNSIVDLKAAKAQYGIIVAGGQIGAIAGCTLVVGSNTFGERARNWSAQFSARNSSARNSSERRRRRSQASPSCTPSAACSRSSRR